MGADAGFGHCAACRCGAIEGSFEIFFASGFECASCQFTFPDEKIIVVGVGNYFGSVIPAPSAFCGLADHIQFRCRRELSGVFDCNRPVFKVETQTVYAGSLYNPFVVGSYGEDKLIVFNSVLVDLDISCCRTYERCVPAACLYAGFEFSDIERTFIYEFILRFLFDRSRIVDIPCVQWRCIAYEIERLGLNRLDFRSFGFAKIGCAHRPVAQIESQMIDTCIRNAPFVVRIACMHVEHSIGYCGFADFYAVVFRTDKGRIPASCGKTQFHFAGVEVAFPFEDQWVCV